MPGLGITLTTLGAPPRLDTVDGEPGGVVGGTHEHRAQVSLNIVDAIRHGDGIGIRAEVVVVNAHRFAVPLGAGVFECTDQLLFLGIDADDGAALCGTTLAQCGDTLKLGVAVGVWRPATTLLVVDPKRKVHLFE